MLSGEGVIFDVIDISHEKVMSTRWPPIHFAARSGHYEGAFWLAGKPLTRHGSICKGQKKTTAAAFTTYLDIQGGLTAATAVLAVETTAARLVEV